jgi:MFS transporter, DHA2 family, multidrug resistance protein
LISCIFTPFLLPRHNAHISEVLKLDNVPLFLKVISASLVIGLKQAPRDGWLSLLCVALFALAILSAFAVGWRTLRARYPIVELSTLRDRSFAVGCAMSFCLSIGLFGSVYLMPVFLALSLTTTPSKSVWSFGRRH